MTGPFPEALQGERAALAYDQALLLRADDIEQLHERRIQIRAGKTDLPKRRAELARAEADLNRLATELDWKTGGVDQLIARIPARAKVAGARTLLNRRGQLHAAVENAKTAVEEADEKVAELSTQRNEAGAEIDISRLSAVIKTTRDVSDIASRIATIEREAQDVRSKIARSLKSLRPAVPDQQTLESLPVPPLDSIQTHRDTCRNLEQRMQACRERMRLADQELARHRKAFARIASEAQVVAAGELQRLRHHRDAGWSIIRRRYVDGTSVPESEALAFSAPKGLPHAFEAAVRDADQAADQRFEKSEAAARLVVIARQIDEQNDLLESLAAEEQALAADNHALTIAWRAMWAAAAPVTPHDPDVMIEWLRARSGVLDLIPKLAEAERQIATLQRQEFEAKRLVQLEFDALGVPSASLAGQPLHLVIESAAAVERGYEDAAKTQRELETALSKTTGDAARKRKALEKAELDWTAWTTQWGVALAALQLPAVSLPETADAQINAIDDMRVVAGRINELQHERIEKIERDVSAFEHDVGALVQAIAPQLAKVEPEDAVLDLERLVEEGARVRDLVAAKDLALVGLQKKIGECQESYREAREVIGQFQAAADVATIDATRIAIERSDRLRALQTEFEQLTNMLAQDGDGLSIAALSDECAAIDLDDIAAREQTISRELQDLRDRHVEARENRSKARRELEAIGGDDRAASDAADRQAALAETRQIAEQYVRLRSAVLLLQWAIDRYRREKQAPMLKRASELFATLTGGSFETLQLEFDQDDKVHLAGMRQNGKRVGIAGMSTGTADQLYLALRVAAIEDYLDHAAPMPFIADDLFINFDNRRAAAGFRVLGELAKKTQVLFFTHHQHLLEVARDTLGTIVPTVVLPAVDGLPESNSGRSAAA